jgi:hypothetical protein
LSPPTGINIPSVDLFEEFGATSAEWRNRDERANVGVDDVLTFAGSIAMVEPSARIAPASLPAADLVQAIDRMRTLVSRINRRITELERRHDSLDRMVDVLHARDLKARRKAMSS